jgi:hypothetical protein
VGGGGGPPPPPPVPPDLRGGHSQSTDQLVIFDGSKRKKTGTECCGSGTLELIGQ